MGMPRLFDDNWVIYKVASNNPHKEMTHRYYSFESYRDGMTCSDYLNQKYDATLPIKWGRQHSTYTGPALKHFKWDLDHGYIRIAPRLQMSFEPSHSPETIIARARS
jgi:hypothetical protein